MAAASGAGLLHAWISGEAVATTGTLKELNVTVPKETEVEILRLHHAEGWPIGTVADQLNVHHSVVERVLKENPEQLRMRRSIADNYLLFVKSTLAKYPKLNATALYRMVQKRGYPGGVDHFRDIVARYRPRPAREAHPRVSTLPGEQAQVDWAHFAKIKIGNCERRLLAFVMVLSWSRHMFVRFYLGDGTANFLRGHVDAFSSFGYVPREVLYDNLKSAVIERAGQAIHFNPEILSLAAHYRFAPKPTGVRQPTAKGRVERAIRYVRESFFAAREWRDLDDLNEQVLDWCRNESSQRRWAEGSTQTVAQAFENETQYLLALPNVPYPVYDRKAVHVDKTAYVRFDLCDYSVPHKLVGKTLTAVATLEDVTILDGTAEIARHKRSFEKGKQIEDKTHTEELIDQKKLASKHRGMDRLRHAAPSCSDLLKWAAERGHNLGRLTQQLTQLLDLYGPKELESAVKEALAADSPHASGVQQILEQRRTKRGLQPPVALTFANDRQGNQITVVPKSLDIYDNLLPKNTENNA